MHAAREARSQGEDEDVAVGLSFLRVRTEAADASSLLAPGVSAVSCCGTLAMSARAFCSAPSGWLVFFVCFLPRALLLVCTYLCTDGDGRMRAIASMLRATSKYVPRNLVTLQLVTDIAPRVPGLRWLQLRGGGGGISTCPACQVAGGGEWLWPTALVASASPHTQPRARSRGEGSESKASSYVPLPFPRPPALDPPLAQRRLVLYIHGGAFALCNPSTHRSLTANIARHLNCPVLATTYRRSPQHSFPEALDGLLALYRTLLANFTPAGLIVAGESAGANLALALCLRAAQLGLTGPGGLVLISPWVDLSDTDSDSWRRNEQVDYLPADLARMFAEAYAGASPLNDEGISPLYATDLPLAPRTLVVYGAGECLADQQAALVARLREASVPTTAYACPGGVHGFPLFADAAYWGWNRKAGGVATSAKAKRGAPVRAPEASASLRDADSAAHHPAASHARGGNVDPYADRTSPGAVQAFTVMREFAEQVWEPLLVQAAAAAARAEVGGESATGMDGEPPATRGMPAAAERT